MSLDALYYNYIFVGKKYCDLTLLNDSVFPLILNAVSPVLAYTNIKKCRVSSEQYVNQRKIKLGRMHWNKKTLLPICQNYKKYPGNNSFHFGFLKAEFPSIEAAYKKKETVDIYLQIENDLPLGRVNSDGDCGVLVSLREDIIEADSGALVIQALKYLYEIFNNVKALFCKRSWWSASKDEERAMRDVAAYRAIDKLSAQHYSDWIEIDLPDLFKNTIKQKQIELLENVLRCVESSTYFNGFYSKWDNIEEASAELLFFIERIKKDDASVNDDVHFLFAPAGTLQDFSIDNGWGKKFLELAEISDKVFV